MLVAMLSLRSRSCRSGFSLQLIRHLSIKVPSLRKKNLVAQLLRGKASAELTISTQRGELFLDAARHKSAKSTHLLQEGEASLKSVYPNPPLNSSAEFPSFENGRQEDNDTCIAHSAGPSLRTKKGVQHIDVPAKISVLALREGCKADPCEGETKLPWLSKLSLPSRIKGSQARFGFGATQPAVGAQGASKRQASNCDGKPFRTKENPSLKLGFSKEISSSATELRVEPGKCLGRKLFFDKEEEEDEVKNAVEHNLFELKSAVERDIGKQLEVEKLVELYSETIEKALTDTFLDNWQRMRAGKDRFLSDLQQKLELVNAESVEPIRVKAFLVNREFLYVSPKKLADMLTLLNQFFESSEKSFEVLARYTDMMVQPMEHLEERLKVLVKFDVDKATCFRFANVVLSLRPEKLRRSLSALKNLGLNAESRNRIICKEPRMLKCVTENHMQMIVNFFESVEISRPTVMKLLEACPQLLWMMPEKNLRVMYELFQHVGLSSTEYIEALRQQGYVRPDIFLHYNLFTKEGFSDETFAGMITGNPGILSLTVKCVEAKLNFLLHEAKWEISDAVSYPRYFNYSLANRIIPRFKLLEKMNLSRRPTLSTLVASSTFALKAV